MRGTGGGEAMQFTQHGEGRGTTAERWHAGTGGTMQYTQHGEGRGTAAGYAGNGEQRDLHSRGWGGDGSGITAVCRGWGSNAINTARGGTGIC